MDKNAIIEELARGRQVEEILERNNISSPYVSDLAQDIYVQLLEKDGAIIEGLYERGELLYFVRKMITNNIFSVTSPYYRKYEDFRKRSDELKEYANYRGTE